MHEASTRGWWDSVRTVALHDAPTVRIYTVLCTSVCAVLLRITALYHSTAEHSFALWHCVHLYGAISVCLCRYESIWEGDSFTIAFPTATHAAKFALALQQALLHLAWPSALLSTEQGGELWFVRTDPSATIPMHEHDAGADSKRSQDTQACGSNRQSLDMTHMGIQTILQSGEYEVYHTSRQRDSAPTRMQQQHGKHHVPMHGLMQWPKPPSSGQIDTQFEAYMGDSECGTISTNQDSMGLTSTWDGQSAVGSTHVGKKRKGVFGKLSLVSCGHAMKVNYPCSWSVHAWSVHAWDM